MEQKVIRNSYQVSCDGEFESDINEMIEGLIIDGWTVKQISTCSSCKNYPNQPSETYIHVFLLAEKGI